MLLLAGVTCVVACHQVVIHDDVDDQSARDRCECDGQRREHRVGCLADERRVQRSDGRLRYGTATGSWAYYR